jgi:hypothetical protein
MQLDLVSNIITILVLLALHNRLCYSHIPLILITTKTSAENFVNESSAKFFNISNTNNFTLSINYAIHVHDEIRRYQIPIPEIKPDAGDYHSITPTRGKTQLCICPHNTLTTCSADETWGKLVQITAARQGPYYNAYIFVFLGSIIICRLYNCNSFRLSPGHSTAARHSFRFSVKIFSRSALSWRPENLSFHRVANKLSAALTVILTIKSDYFPIQDSLISISNASTHWLLEVRNKVWAQYRHI